MCELVAEFGDVLQAKPSQTRLAKHSINTDSAHPVRLAPYRIPYAYRDLVEKEFELKEMSESGIIEPSHSDWAAPIVVVKKKDNSIRLCVDYRRLNSVTPADAYPMPRADELIDKLGSAKFITTLDYSLYFPWIWPHLPVAYNVPQVDTFLHSKLALSWLCSEVILT